MPDILIDISRLFYRKVGGRLPTGIDRVSLEYIRHYADRARAVLTLGPFSPVLSREDSADAFRMLLDPAASPRAARLVMTAFLRWWVPTDVSDRVFFNTGHSGLDHPWHARSLRRRGARPVFFVHDLIPITHPEYCRPGEKERHAARMRTALATGRGLIVPSRDTLDALKRFSAETGLPLPQAIVAPLATNLPPADAGPRPLAEPYFVALGTIEPRKNHLLLLQLWQAMAARYKAQATRHKEELHDPVTHHSSLVTRHSGKSDAIPRLVIIGHRGWEIDKEIELLDRCEELRGLVIEKSRCSDAELVTYLRHAQALLFPTFTEGYGLPLAEALSLGVPVIASDLAVFREVAGEIPDYATPFDDKRWMELIEDYAGAGSARRTAQIGRMKGFRATTWEQHFEKVDDFLEQEMGNGK